MLEGARQVGKTFILRKFARENYKQEIYINLRDVTGEVLNKILDEKKGTFYNMHKVLEQYTDGVFKDTRDTIIIIDEAQESSYVSLQESLDAT